MNVLSVFDGISCGMAACLRAGIPVTSYQASEIDKHAIAISRKNYPEIIRLGDIQKIHVKDLAYMPDLLIGGSPCQGFSFSGKGLNFNDPRSALFFEYLRLWKELKALNPNARFLLENVKMKKEHLAVISEHMGVEGMLINSALVSAQSRPRFYWFNWSIDMPADRGILLKDILLQDFDEKLLISPNHIKRLQESSDVPKKFSAIDPEKALCMTARQFANWKGTYVTTAKGIRRLDPIECERLQTLPDGFTAGVADSHRYKALGNGWTVDVIAHILQGVA